MTFIYANIMFLGESGPRGYGQPIDRTVPSGRQDGCP